MIYLFVDTNIYIGAGYTFSNDFFSTIAKYSNAGEVKLLTCNICKNEVISNIKNDIETIIKPINSKLKKGIFYALRKNPEYSAFYNFAKEADVEKALMSEFNLYLERVDAEFFSIEEISVEELMEDYFLMNPPFEPKKPKEFKDAIMIKALKAYQQTIGQKIHILSSDAGFRAAFANDDNFIVYEYHKQFIQYLSRRDEVCYAFEEYCESERNEIYDLICEYIQNCEFYDYDKAEFEVLDAVNVTDIDSIFLYCHIINEDTVKLLLLVNADCRITTRYLDEENSIYDSEEKEYLYRTYLDVVEDHCLQFEIILTGTYTISDSDEENLIDKYGCEVHSINAENSDSVIEINRDTLIEEISCEKYVPLIDRMFLHETSVYCSECGKRIGFSGDEQYYTYENEPLCNECMRDNGSGFVCPNCAKIP